ncbi:portal protein [Roseomonas sp. NAR14]|uniref:Portal protein n=1 Tax=Roseomonas acroporae TaxID=2937791 RepID=A0A9X2BXR0_9PROT|nr:portal protein [Roseomonas acroporae]MCK8785220.1 portal protein [Roseomonas acroporae]
MAADAKELARLYQAAKGRRQPLEALLTECYEHGLPLRDRPNQQAIGGAVVQNNVFDSTAAFALQRFASSMLTGIWPTNEQPFDLQAGSDAQGGRDAEGWLAALTRTITTEINSSRFRSEAHAAMEDFGVGTGVMIANPGSAIEPVRFEHVPLSTAYLSQGPDGRYDGLFRPRRLEVRHVPVLYPRARLPDRWRDLLDTTPEEKVQVVEICTRDWGQPAEEVWQFAVLPDDGGSAEEVVAENEWRGAGSCPFLAWDFERSGGAFGRGPMQVALPDIRQLNKLMEIRLEALDMQLTGVWQYDDDGVLNPDTVDLSVPGTLIPRAPGGKGLEPLTPRFDLRPAETEAERLTGVIKGAFYIPDLGPTTKTPMSATEVMQRTADRAEALSSAYGSLLVDFLFPLVRRVYWILRHHQGQAGAGWPRLDGRQVAIRPLAPLTRAMAQGEVLRFTQFTAVHQQVAGPQATLLAVNTDAATPWLADRLGIDPSLIRTAAEKAAMMQQGMALAQQAGMLPQPEAPAV